MITMTTTMKSVVKNTGDIMTITILAIQSILLQIFYFPRVMVYTTMVMISHMIMT
jgi:hypothetical protein